MAKAPAGSPAQSATADHKPAYTPPKGVETTIAVPALGRSARVRANADWLIIRENGIPAAEVFFTSYQLAGLSPAAREKRPIMFLFNGGPGAASAFLHMGTAGPMRVEFTKSGAALAPPASVVPNAETWLRFADLVFVDPVGTGLSRTVAESRLEQSGLDADDDKREKRTKDLPDAKKTFFKIKRDIDILAEFASQFLSREKRWGSPVHIAGESYGGFRVGKLMRALPERGVGLCGAFLISPAIDFLSVVGSDYDLLCWTSVVPTMALTARHHSKVRGRFARLSQSDLARAAEDFAFDDLAPVLLRGDTAPPRERDRVFSEYADLIGIPAELVHRFGGRVRIDMFARELLRKDGLLCGLYDASVTGPNMFPDRESDTTQTNPDPTLDGITAAFATAANMMLRSPRFGLGLLTDREYHLMSQDAWKMWTDDRMSGYWHRQLEAADDMRFGMGASPHLRVFIAHGLFDLVTTYFSSAQTVSALRLPPALRSRVQLANYPGGHMFYTWEQSRKAVVRDVERVVRG